MSSGAGTTFGTNSPPLTASGQDQPMGVSGISGHKPDAVPDIEQRQGYFKGVSPGGTSEGRGHPQNDTLPDKKIKHD